MFQTEIVDKIERHILFLVTFPPENRDVYEIMWKNLVESVGAQMKIRRLRFACFINKATNTHSEYVLVIAFPQQQWLRERASMLRYT
jgi:hypothetical protein